MKDTKLCSGCGKEYIPRFNIRTKKLIENQKYCSPKCRTTFNRASWSRGLSSSVVGAIAELLVCLDLMKKGYEVFRNLSPCGINDIVAYKNKKYCGIDVKSMHTMPSPLKILDYSEKVRADYIAFIVLKTGEIKYEPLLE